MISKIKKIWQNPNERTLIINIMLAFFIKGLSLIISLFSTPLYIDYFDNNTVLGVWYTILSVLSWITIADLGLGNGLRNQLTQDLARKDNESAKNHISAAYVAITLIIFPVLLIGIILICSFDMNSLLNISTDIIDAKTLKLSIVILFLGICLQFIVNIISTVLYAMQMSSVNNVKALIRSIIPLIFVLVFKTDSIETNLIALSIVHSVSMLLPSIIATVILFGKKLKNCRPSIFCYKKIYAKDIMSLGLKFFVAQIFFMFLMSTNEFLINRFYTPADVVEYSIYHKPFTAVGSIFLLSLTPLWSKVTKDITEKRISVVKKTNRILYGLSGFCMISLFVSILFLQWFFDLWLKEDSIEVSIITAVSFAFFGGVYVFNVALTTIANGIGELKTQMLFYGIGTVFKVPATYIMSSMSCGWNSIVLYNAIVLAVFCVFQLFWIEKRIKKFECEIRSNKDVTF